MGSGEGPGSPGARAATLTALGERGLIERIRRRRRPAGRGVLAGIGDDAAVAVWPSGERLLLTTDTLLEGVHFRRRWSTLRDVGAKALLVNVSDIAAMGGEPRFAVLALVLPPSLAPADVDELYAGLDEAAEAYGVALVGGDTSAAPGGIGLTVTLVGGVAGDPIYRSGAQPGDAILVTGTLGAAAAGLAVLERESATGVPDAVAAVCRAHRRPTPRVAEARIARISGAATAMIDLSDGLATDLGHIARESGVGATVRVPMVPVSAATRAVAGALGADPVGWALSGGEDYELLLTASADRAPGLARAILEETGTLVSLIGEVRPAAAGVAFLDDAGRPVPVRPGFDHFA